MTSDDALLPAGEFSVYAPGWARHGAATR
jgi:hypothetical protein